MFEKGTGYTLTYFMDVLQLLKNFRIIQKWSRHACLFNIHSAMEEMSMGFFTGEKKYLTLQKMPNFYTVVSISNCDEVF